MARRESTIPIVSGKPMERRATRDPLRLARIVAIPLVWSRCAENPALKGLSSRPRGLVPPPAGFGGGELPCGPRRGPFGPGPSSGGRRIGDPDEGGDDLLGQ